VNEDDTIARGEKTGAATTDATGNEPELKVVDRRWWARGQAQADAGASGQEQWTPRKPTYVEELEGQLAEKDKLLQEYIGRYREAAREFDSVKARMRRELLKDVGRGKQAMLVELLDVVDNLERAIDAARGSGGPGSILQGVEMVRDQFLAKLAGFGVARMKPLGQKFDPGRHEAASLVPMADVSQDNVVVGVIREGYESDTGEVLRPALVAVGRAGEA
jgi:molecular chaperone GrpE